MSPEKYPAIIIGAGIGGLSTAAYLSKLGISSLLLEQSDQVGGRCSTRTINELNYEIGALYIGGGAFDCLRQTFGASIHTAPVRCAIKIGNNLASIPISWKTPFEWKDCGASWTEIISFLFRIRALKNPAFVEKFESVGQIFDILAPSGAIRRFIDTIFGVSGVSPYRLPSGYLSGDNPANRYKMLNPEYMPSGNGAIPSVLHEISKKHCKTIFNAKVDSIIIENGRAVGVSASCGKYYCDAVVSNAGLKSTVLKLTSQGDWPPEFYAAVVKTEESLSVVNIFLTFKRTFSLPRGYSVFFMPYDITSDFQALERGRFPDHSMYIMHVPTNIGDDGAEQHTATLQFYYPRRAVSSDALTEQANKIMNSGLDNLFAGLSQAVTGFEVYDPSRYQKEFGFSPHVFNLSPDLNYPSFSLQTRIPGLYCVGDSVAPHGPCVPQAMESGIECARIIADSLPGHHER
jgi:phytoene dehydrogenase-like protein